MTSEEFNILVTLYLEKNYYKMIFKEELLQYRRLLNWGYLRGSDNKISIVTITQKGIEYIHAWRDGQHEGQLEHRNKVPEPVFFGNFTGRKGGL